MIVEKYPSSKK